MNSECILSRFDLVRVLILMTGLNAHLSILVRMPEEEIQGSSIIAVSLALILGRGLADVEICVSMLMGFLSAGCTQLNIELVSARMEQIAPEEFAFFAHTNEELRPLYVSNGSAVPSPRSSTSSAMDFAAAMSMLPGSPSSMSVISPSPFTPPMSPSANGMSHSSLAWPQPNVPTLHLPGSNPHSNHLRSSLNARDIPMEDFDMLADYDVQQQQQQLLNEFSCLSQQSMNSNSINRPGRIKTMTPSNLDDLFSSKSSSPRLGDPPMASAVFSPTHKSAVLNQFQQQQQQNLLSLVKANFSSKNVEHPLLQASFGVQPSGMMSPRNVEPISPMSSRLSMLAQREK